MANHFQNRKQANHEMDMLRMQLRDLRVRDEVEHREYLRQLRGVMVSHPNKTAAQIAALMTEDEAERTSIKASVAGLGYASVDSRRKYPTVKKPTMPEMRRDSKKVTRRFLEVDDTGMVLSTFTKEEEQYIYSIEVY